MGCKFVMPDDGDECIKLCEDVNARHDHIILDGRTYCHEHGYYYLCFDMTGSQYDAETYCAGCAEEEFAR